MTLGPPPCFWPQFPHPGLAPGASRELEPVEPQASHTPPSAARLPAPLTLEGGRSRDAHHCQAPWSRAPCLRPWPGSLTDTAAGPVDAELANPSETASVAGTTAVRPRTAPPPRWPRPTRQGRPQRALSPARPTLAEAWPKDQLPLNPAPRLAPPLPRESLSPIPEHPASQIRPSCVTAPVTGKVHFPGTGFPR